MVIVVVLVVVVVVMVVAALVAVTVVVFLVVSAMWRYAYVESVEPINSCTLLRDCYCLSTEKFTHSSQEFILVAL
jgi:hypothetical protein